MRILHVVHQYAPATGGAEKYVVDLSEALVARGHQVDVYTSRSTDYRSWNNALPMREKLNGVDVYRFDSLRRGNMTWRVLHKGYQQYQLNRAKRYEPMIYLGNGPVMPGMAASLLRNAAAYDVVHIANLHYAHALTAYKAARRTRLPIVLSPLIHIEQPLTYDVDYMLAMLQDADGLVTLTRAERDFILVRYPEQRITVGGVGLDLTQFTPQDKVVARRSFGLPEDAYVVLFLGRKTDYKHLDLVYAAFEELVSKDKDAYMLAVGPDTDSSMQLAEQFAHVPNVVLRGRVEDSERLAALACADVLAMPSVGESFGIVYLEAWAYQIPVIGANVAAVSSLIDDGVNGTLTEVGSMQSVYDALQWVRQHPMQARAMGQAGYDKVVSRYQLSRIADVVEGAYVRAIRHYNSKGFAY